MVHSFSEGIDKSGSLFCCNMWKSQLCWLQAQLLLEGQQIFLGLHVFSTESLKGGWEQWNLHNARQHLLGNIQLHWHLCPRIDTYSITLFFFTSQPATFLNQKRGQKPQRCLGWSTEQNHSAPSYRAYQASGKHGSSLGNLL